MYRSIIWCTIQNYNVLYDVPEILLIAISIACSFCELKWNMIRHQHADKGVWILKRRIYSLTVPATSPQWWCKMRHNVLWPRRFNGSMTNKWISQYKWMEPWSILIWHTLYNPPTRRSCKAPLILVLTEGSRVAEAGSACRRSMASFRTAATSLICAVRLIPREPSTE